MVVRYDCSCTCFSFVYHDKIQNSQLELPSKFFFLRFLLLDIDLEIFFEATEDWNSAMALSNSMAFISQFGEVRFRKAESVETSAL